METFDDLGQALGPVPFDGEALLARVVVQGRRLQRRRRIAAGAGVAALGALAVVPGAVSFRSGHAEVPSDHPSSGAPISPEHASEHLAALLPGPSAPMDATGSHHGDQVVRTFDPDGRGRGMVMLDLEPASEISPRQLAGAAGACHTVQQTHAEHGTWWGDGCTAVTGGWLFTYIDRLPTGRTGAVDWSAKLITEDGRDIWIGASNYVTGQPPTRREPVLDADELAQLVMDPGWFEPAS